LIGPDQADAGAGVDGSLSDGSNGETGGGDGAGGKDTGNDVCTDNDNDKQSTCAGDCNDSDPDDFTGNVENCGDGKDNNCNNQADEGAAASVRMPRGSPETTPTPERERSPSRRSPREFRTRNRSWAPRGPPRKPCSWPEPTTPRR